jgi:dTDP-4-dehydrorhamnose 3,5-epimerase
MKKSKFTTKINGVHIFEIEKFNDERGWLLELFRKDELPKEIFPKMAYISMTKPGIMRGPHQHNEQTDYFAFIGPAEFEVHLWHSNWGTSHEIFKINSPHVIIVPPHVIHAYKNISEDALGLVFNGPNTLYAGKGKLYPVDELRYENNPNIDMEKMLTIF